jgi:hypothetical protein
MTDTSDDGPAAWLYDLSFAGGEWRPTVTLTHPDECADAPDVEIRHVRPLFDPDDCQRAAGHARALAGLADGCDAALTRDEQQTLDDAAAFLRGLADAAGTEDEFRTAGEPMTDGGHVEERESLTDELVSTATITERGDIEEFLSSLEVPIHNRWVDLRSKELGAIDYEPVELVVSYEFRTVESDDEPMTDGGLVEACPDPEHAHEPVDVPADDGRDYRQITACEGCGAPGARKGGVALRAIKMRKGRRRMLCMGCFTHELDRGTVDPSDPRVENHGWGGDDYA